MTKKYLPATRFKVLFSTTMFFCAIWIFSAWVENTPKPFVFSGQVTGSTKAPLIGASVMIKGTTIGTVTDLQGRFSLNAPDSCVTLAISYTGFLAVEKEGVCASDHLLFSLDENITLDEVVVIGYGAISCGPGESRSVASLSAREKKQLALKSKITPSGMEPATLTARGVAALPVPGMAISREVAGLSVAYNGIQGKPGTLTAGEVSDFSKWDLWSDVSGEDLAQWRTFWQMYPSSRYTLQLLTPTGSPAVDYPVRLTGRGGEVIWQTRTDNTGKAELWSGLFTGENNPKPAWSLEVETADGPVVIDDLSVFQQGINFLRIPEPCREMKKMDIAFVVDATGSMQDEIDYLKAELSDVIGRVKDTLPDLEINLGSVFYRDVRDAYLTLKSDFSPDLGKTLGFIDAQNAAGGGDTPEAVEEALRVAVEELTWQEEAVARLLFLVLDAPPHHTDEILASLEKTVRLAAQKGIRIIPLACSGTDKSTEYLMRSLALATNGTYTFLTNDSGIGNPHIEPTTDKYEVEKLNALLARVIFNFAYTADCETFIAPQAIAALDTAVVDFPAAQPDDNPANPVRMRIFPNPTAGPLTLEIEGEAKEVFLADFSGKILARFPVENPRLNLHIGQYPAGTYFLRLLKSDQEGSGGRVVLVKG